MYIITIYIFYVYVKCMYIANVLRKVKKNLNLVLKLKCEYICISLLF